MWKKIISILYCWILASQMLSQRDVISFHPMYGSLFKHSPAFNPKITEFSQGFYASYSRRPISGSTFYEKFNYPSFGVNLIANRYGDNDTFGNSLGLAASLNFYLIYKPKFNLQFNTGIGIGYVTKEYDYTNNKAHNAIGSHINMCPHIFLTGEFMFFDQISLRPSVGVVHYSNGHIQLPNLGINYLHGSIGVGYCLKNGFKKDSFRNNGVRIPRLKNEISLLQGLSDRGSQDDNRILPTYGIMYNRLFYTSDINVLKLGMSAEYKNNDYGYGTYTFEENADLALTLGDELFFGRMSFNVLIGIYIHSYLSYEKKKYTYQRWGLSYRIPLKSEKISIIAGAHLKVHLGAAELTEARISLLF